MSAVKFIGNYPPRVGDNIILSINGANMSVKVIDDGIRPLMEDGGRVVSLQLNIVAPEEHWVKP